ncbi:MAG: class I SAM-dependent methyltransferase [Ignavibacteria bacterium]|nr:class I SAM-dependent methyltransferase [Ignavibacteria bacterium]
MVRISYEYTEDPSHPNYTKWTRSKNAAIKKGEFVKSILAKSINLENKKILDLGSGSGGTLQNFLGSGNQLFSVDHSDDKLKAQKIISHEFNLIYSLAEKLPFKQKYFDVIILQDSLEHFTDPYSVLNEIKNLLNEDGVIYISTPNKFSIINLFADPHWGFPFVALFPRILIRKIFIPLFRRQEIGRPGVAQLLSYKQLRSFFDELSLKSNIYTIEAVHTLISKSEQIIWSKFHITLLKILASLKFERLLTLMANNKPGILNRYFTPTFYFTLKKR